jgi:hypothetical protein
VSLGRKKVSHSFNPLLLVNVLDIGFLMRAPKENQGPKSLRQLLPRRNAGIRILANLGSLYQFVVGAEVLKTILPKV